MRQAAQGSYKGGTAKVCRFRGLGSPIAKAGRKFNGRPATVSPLCAGPQFPNQQPGRWSNQRGGWEIRFIGSGEFVERISQPNHTRINMLLVSLEFEIRK
jgi:hypothetical protein